MPKSKFVPSDVKLWGESSEEKRNIISDKLLMTLIRGAEKQEEPKLKLPVTDDEEEESFLLPNHFTKQNECVLHTIRLNEHAKAFEVLIEGVKAGKTEFENCPPIPEIISCNIKDEKDDKAKVTYNFQLGQGPEFPILDNENVNKMLEKAILVILAETGFTKAKKSSVHVLIDVVRYILTKVCRLLHMFSQEDVMKGRTLYKDPLEKVLQLLGMSGIKDLHNFYQKNVVGKMNLALKRSVSLVNRYNTLVNKMKDQAAIEADEPNVSDVNVPSVNVVEPIKIKQEPGFQPIKQEPGFQVIKQEPSFVTVKQEPGFQMLFDLKTEPQPGPSTSHNFSNNSLAKTIIKKKISSNILQNRSKKQKTDT